jgi:hypothetical protein
LDVRAAQQAAWDNKIAKGRKLAKNAARIYERDARGVTRRIAESMTASASQDRSGAGRKPNRAVQVMSAVAQGS